MGYFITFSVVQWVDVFTRESHREIFVDSLRYCQKEKGLTIYAWVLMSNHIHLIVSAKEGFNLSDILRDLKKFTSKAIISNIDQSTESRRGWMLWFFRSAGQRNSNNINYKFWQQDNLPIELKFNTMINQRLNYIHENPVKAGLVRNAEDYIYSSAINYSEGKGLIDLNFLNNFKLQTLIYL